MKHQSHLFTSLTALTKVSCRPMDATVLGAGSWGTALAILLARNGHRVTLVGRHSDELAQMRATRRNPRYLSDFPIPESVAFAGFDQRFGGGDILVIAVPSSAVRNVVCWIGSTSSIVVVASKGLEFETSMLMTEVVSSTLHNADIGVLSGPNLAVEIARCVPTVAIAAFNDRKSAETVREVFCCKTLRVSIGNDVKGVELAGALKNVLAIGAGMSDGLGFGDNTKGAFLSRGLMEMSNLGIAMGAKMETFLGPAGVGDLFATAASGLSRNYRLGKGLGMGGSVVSMLRELGQVAEGVPTSHAAAALAARYQVDMPVFAAVEAVLQAKVSPLQAVGMLMERASRMSDFL